MAAREPRFGNEPVNKEGRNIYLFSLRRKGKLSVEWDNPAAREIQAHWRVDNKEARTILCSPSCRASAQWRKNAAT